MSVCLDTTNQHQDQGLYHALNVITLVCNALGQQITNALIVIKRIIELSLQMALKKLVIAWRDTMKILQFQQQCALVAITLASHVQGVILTSVKLAQEMQTSVC